MTVHGITTSDSVFWVHFLPLDKAIYCYERVLFNERRAQFQTVTSRSGTGWGWLLPKIDRIIVKRDVSRFIVLLNRYDWINTTDRQFGAYHGPEVFVELVKAGALEIFGTDIRELRSRAAQLAAKDFMIGRIPIELKCERVQSPFLFVQVGEADHNPNLLPDGTQIVVPLKPWL